MVGYIQLSGAWVFTSVWVTLCLAYSTTIRPPASYLSVQGTGQWIDAQVEDRLTSESCRDRWSLLLLLSASPAYRCNTTPGLPAASGYSVTAWDRTGALSRIRSSPNNGQGRLELLTGEPTVHPGILDHVELPCGRTEATWLNKHPTRLGAGGETVAVVGAGLAACSPRPHCRTFSRMSSSLSATGCQRVQGCAKGRCKAHTSIRFSAMLSRRSDQLVPGDRALYEAGAVRIRRIRTSGSTIWSGRCRIRDVDLNVADYAAIA